MRALIISTGGTIVSIDKGGGAAPDEHAAEGIAGAAKRRLEELGYDCDTVSAFGSAGCDSSDISPVEWVKLTELINDAILKRGIKKFLIIHGTDTMAYAAAWLTLTARNGATVVLTGSQHTPESKDFDGYDNISGAADLLAAKDGGVYIHFHAKDYSGAYVHKENSESVDAYVASDRGSIPRLILNDLSGYNIEDLRYAAELMDVIYMYPSRLPVINKKSKITVIIGYGAGNMPQRFHRAMIEAFPADSRRPAVIAASSCALGKKDPSIYGGVGIAELSKYEFPVFSQGSYSLEFIIALSYLALLLSPEEPGRIINLYLEKF